MNISLKEYFVWLKNILRNNEVVAICDHLIISCLVERKIYQKSCIIALYLFI